MVGYANTTGGAGGTALTVTNLNDTGPGSLRQHLGESFPRTITFDQALSGIIQLDSQVVIEADCTLDGIDAQQVVLTGSRLSVQGNDVIIRNMKISPLDGPGQNKGERDCIGVGKNGSTISNVLIEQNSLKWSTDECGGTWYDVEDITLFRNLIFQPLKSAGHDEGDHSMGMLIGQTPTRVTVAQNIFAACEFRSPDVKGAAVDVEVFNNLISSWGNMGLQFFTYSNTVAAGNVFESGPDTSSTATRQMMLHGGVYYIWDNVPQIWELRSGASVIETQPPGFPGSGYLAADWSDQTFSECVERRGGDPLLPSRMIRSGKWKLWIYTDKENLPPALFNLAEDPGELHDLGQDPAHADIRDELLAKLFADWDPQWVADQAWEGMLSYRTLQEWGKAVGKPFPLSVAYPPPELEDDVELL